MTQQVYNQIEKLVNEFNEKNVKHFDENYAYKAFPHCGSHDDLWGMYIKFYNTFFSTDLEEILEIKNKHNLTMFMGTNDGDAFIYLQ